MSYGKIPFNRPTYASDLNLYIEDAIFRGSLSGDGYYTAKCHDYIESMSPRSRSFLTTSCTSALEMATLLLAIQPGDEVIMPSWTFPSTANCVAMRGATPIFVDVRPQSLTIDVNEAADAVSSRTRGIICVHYAGLSCDMDSLVSLCSDRNLVMIEDAAQAFGSLHSRGLLGGIGDFGAFSFHGTKEISVGEGGALTINNEKYYERAKLVWEKGTNASDYRRGLIEKYQWVDIGSSFLPSELTASALFAQMNYSKYILDCKRSAWAAYSNMLRPSISSGLLDIVEPEFSREINGHLFAIRVPGDDLQVKIVEYMQQNNIDVRTHYQPLHTSPAGRRFGQVRGSMRTTERAAGRLIRLPIDAVISVEEQARVVDTLLKGIRLLSA